MARFSNIFLSYFSGHQTTSEEVLSEPWFLALLGSVVLTVLILIFVGIILYRKQWSRQKGLGQLSLPGIIKKIFFLFPILSLQLFILSRKNYYVGKKRVWATYFSFSF